jgi:DNA-binding transcriptional regulator GbsR (MarR family)
VQSVGETSELGHADENLESPSEFEAECVRFFSEVVLVLGVPRSVGQIYGLLFSSAQPLGFSEIVARLKISKGSASQGLQLLRSLGAVHSVNQKDERRELFVPELGLRKLVGGLLRDRIEPLVSSGVGRVRQLEDLARRTPDLVARRFSVGRVKQLDKWRRQMWLVLPLLKTFLVPPRV